MQHKTIYFYALMAIKKVRCVHIKTGEIGYNNPEAAYNKFWNKSTGFYPQPEPKAEQFKSELTEKPTSSNAHPTTQPPLQFVEPGKKEESAKIVK